MGTSKKDILSAQQELYCQKRAEGLSQRQAYLAAYPRSKKWKAATIDSAACNLEKSPKVFARLKRLQEEAAKRAIVTRKEILDAQGLLLRAGVKSVSNYVLDKESGPAVKAIESASDRLMKWLPPEQIDGGERVFDMSLLLSRDFVDMHRWIAHHSYSEFWCPGGRGSLKTSTVAAEIVAGVSSVEGKNALVMRNRSNKLRTSVYAEIRRAATRLNRLDEFEWLLSPMQAIHKETGNVIYFFGADNVSPEDSQLKGFAPEKGYVAYLWFEEASQFPGYPYIRSVKQTVLRGSDMPTCTFLTYNPPMSANSWVNKECSVLQTGRVVIRSVWRHAPREWLGQEFCASAEALKTQNERAYRHEYEGEQIGTGANVIDPTIIDIRPITDDERQLLLGRVAHGVDAGFVHPWVHERVGYDENARVLYVLNENVRQGSEAHDPKTAALLIEQLEKFQESTDTLWCDSAAANMISFYQEQGLSAIGAYKQGGNSPKERIRWFNSLAKIVIDPEAAPLAAEQFPALEYVITPAGDITETLPKINDDAIDAVGYACGVWIKQRL